MTSTFDWNLLRAFLATLEHGSYSAAGRVLGVAQSTVGRQVATLEEELGVALFERAGNRMTPTEAARRLEAPARRVRGAAEQVRLAAEGMAEALEGTVRITSSEALAVHRLPPLLTALRQRYPGIRLHVLPSDTVRDLVRREADIAVRHARPEHPELVARRLPDGQAAFFATPGYLAANGRPSALAELADHPLLGYADAEAFAAGLRHWGVPMAADGFGALGTSLVQWALCTAGAGIAVMDTAVGDGDPRVERVVPSAPTWAVPLWLVCHRELRTSRRIRVVFDALAEGLSVPR